MSKDKMTPTPWKVDPREYYNLNMCPVPYREIGSINAPWWVAHVKEGEGTGRPDAEAIVSAVNNTYGAGINPEAVKDLLDATEMLYRLANAALGSTSYKNADETLAFAKAAIEKSQIIINEIRSDKTV